MKPSGSLLVLACLYLLYQPCTSRAGAITGLELVRACEHALNNKFSGTEGMACHWYVTPCDCNIAGTSRPRVCLPHVISEYKLARIVIDGIKDAPGLQGKDAAVAANTVLSEVYACMD